MSKVSVIVPVHNTEKYLDKCVQSIKAQTLKDIEIILVENASTDNSLAVCKALAEEDSRIKVIQTQIGDLSHARNFGVKWATSEYVAFVDSDDSIAPDMYESLYGLAAENDLDIVYANHVLVYDKKKPRYNYPETGVKKVLTPKELLMMNFAHKIPLHSGTMIVRKKFFDSMKFPEFTYFEDRAFTYLLINASKKVGYVDKAFYYYYQREGSIVHTMDWKKFYDFAAAERDRLAFIRKSPMFTDREKSIASRMAAVMFIRKLRHVHRKARTREQKRLSKELNLGMRLIPEECRLPIKTRLYRSLIKALY